MNYSFNDNRCELELFHDGDSAHAYNFLGSHFEEWDGRKGVVFRVWAPNALSVSVIGEFNNWNKTADFMHKITYGVWELFIEGLDQFTMYKYCVETQWCEKVLKSDPYAFHSETRPNMASLVYNLDSYKWNDHEWFKNKKNIDTNKMPMNIYEIHLGSWKIYPDGNFFNYRKIANDLVPYLCDMHYTHVEIMPLTEYPLDNSWGYQPLGYFDATSRYGTPDDLMYMIDKLHNAGIGVILDWVPSSFPADDCGLSKYDGTFLYETSCSNQGEPSTWKTSPFNFARYEVISFLVSSAMFWLDKYHFDGIRISCLSSMLYLDYGKEDGEWTPNKFGGKENLEAIDFIKRLNSAVHMYHPDTMMFAQENTSWPKLTHPIEEGGLGFDFKWNLGWMNDMLHYISLDPLWKPFNHDNLTYSFFYAFTEKFLLPISHDEVANGKGSLINKMPGEYNIKFAGVRAFITYMYAHPGKKLIFMGTEIGQFDEWDSRSGIQWDLLDFDSHKKLNNFFRDINKFYLENKPLYELDSVWKGFDWIHHDDFTNSVIAFKRTDSNCDELIAVCNFQPHTREQYIIGVPKYGIYDEVFSSDSKEYGGNGITNGKGIVPKMMKIHGYDQGLSLTLPALSVIFLKCVGKLDEPKNKS